MAKKKEEKKRHYRKSADGQGRAHIAVSVHLTREEVKFVEKKAEWADMTVPEYIAFCAQTSIIEDVENVKDKK